MTVPPRFEGASLLPHRGHARFIREVVATGDDSVVCLGAIPIESPFVRDGVAPGFVLLEFAAQAAAIDALARTDSRGSRSRNGYLARAHGLSWIAAGVPAGAPLTASVRGRDSMPPLHVYRATVTMDGVEVFRGEFSIYIDEDAD